MPDPVSIEVRVLAEAEGAVLVALLLPTEARFWILDLDDAPGPGSEPRRQGEPPEQQELTP